MKKRTKAAKAPVRKAKGADKADVIQITFRMTRADHELWKRLKWMKRMTQKDVLRDLFQRELERLEKEEGAR